MIWDCILLDFGYHYIAIRSKLSFPCSKGCITVKWFHFLNLTDCSTLSSLLMIINQFLRVNIFAKVPLTIIMVSTTSHPYNTDIILSVWLMVLTIITANMDILKDTWGYLAWKQVFFKETCRHFRPSCGDQNQQFFLWSRNVPVCDCDDQNKI